jgi:hypothetical protein
MSELSHDGNIIQTVRETWQTRTRGSDYSEWEIYTTFADDGNGIDFTTGLPLKSFDEWMAS